RQLESPRELLLEGTLRDVRPEGPIDVEAVHEPQRRVQPAGSAARSSAPHQLALTSSGDVLRGAVAASERRSSGGTGGSDFDVLRGVAAPSERRSSASAAGSEAEDADDDAGRSRAKGSRRHRRKPGLAHHASKRTDDDPEAARGVDKEDATGVAAPG